MVCVSFQNSVYVCVSIIIFVFIYLLYVFLHSWIEVLIACGLSSHTVRVWTSGMSRAIQIVSCG